MDRAAGERRPGGRALRRAGGAAIEQASLGAIFSQITEQQRQAKLRSRAAARKLAAERAQVRWLFVLRVYLV